MRTMSETADVEFAEVNARILLVAIVPVSWFALLSGAIDTPNSISVLLEWLVLVVLTMLLANVPFRTPARLRAIPIAGTSFFVV